MIFKKPSNSANLLGANKFNILLLLMLVLQFACGDSKNPVQEDENALLKENLAKAVNLIEGGNYGNVHSLIIYKNNELLVEEYFLDYNKDRLHVLNSVTKSITSALMGIAIDKGLIASVNTKLFDYLPEYNYARNGDSLKAEITLKDILTMRTGIDWQIESFSTRDSPDLIGDILEQPMAFQPGTEFYYHNGNTLLLSAVLEKVTGMPADEFARENLFPQIGIETWRWEDLVYGDTELLCNTAFGLFMRPIDMAKFGLLYLNNGMFENRRVISESWIDESTKASVVGSRSEYGFKWWRLGVERALPDSILAVNDMYYAAGSAGQYIYVVPHLETVIVATGDLVKAWLILEIVTDHILPVIK